MEEIIGKMLFYQFTVNAERRALSSPETYSGFSMHRHGSAADYNINEWVSRIQNCPPYFS